MTILQVMPERGETLTARTEEPAEIARILEPLGVRFERWEANRELSDDADQDDVLAAYEQSVDRLTAEGGYALVDVARMRPDPANPDWPDLAKSARAKFLEEHRHSEDEVRFFVEGRGCFYLHIGTAVYAVVCEAGDLLSVPVGTTHWFDMGVEPSFCAIRFFQESDGWIGDFTGSSIAARIPTLDEIVQAARDA